MQTIIIVFFLIAPYTHIFSLTYQPFEIDRAALQYDRYGTGNYVEKFRQTTFDPKEVETIVEVGSRDAIDAIELSDYFKKHVYAFECNPEGIEICRKNIGKNPNVTLVEKAAWVHTGSIYFFPFDNPGDDRNIGASSCFPLRSKPLRKYQTKIDVDAIRLDEWMDEVGLETIDLLCMDCEGATWQVLRGLGDKLQHVKYLITELNFVKMHRTRVSYDMLHTFLISEGFSQIQIFGKSEMLGDAAYINTRFL